MINERLKIGCLLAKQWPTVGTNLWTEDYTFSLILIFFFLQSFSKFNMYVNYLGILLKCRFWFSMSLVRAWDSASLRNSQWRPKLLVPRPNFLLSFLLWEQTTGLAWIHCWTWFWVVEWSGSLSKSFLQAHFLEIFWAILVVVFIAVSFQVALDGQCLRIGWLFFHNFDAALDAEACQSLVVFLEHLRLFSNCVYV